MFSMVFYVAFKSHLSPTEPGYIGCFGDSFERLFQGAYFDDPVGMTIDACLGFCRSQNFPFAGVEYASECYCADSDTQYDERGTFDDSECQYICSGNTLERCGGNRRISVFNSTYMESGVAHGPVTEGHWCRWGKGRGEGERGKGKGVTVLIGGSHVRDQSTVISGVDEKVVGASPKVPHIFVSV